MLKIRCSALGKIVHFDSSTYLTDNEKGQLNQFEAYLASPPENKLTDKQKEELERLKGKESEGTLTDNQAKIITELRAKREVKPSLNGADAKTIVKLKAKRDADIQLSKGAKTYIRDVFYGEKFEFVKAFTSKQTEKGNACESRAIKQVIKFLRLPIAFKNEQFYENLFIHGTPDVVMKALDFQFDIKCPYEPKGLETFNETLDHDYEWQQHGYNWLLGVSNAAVIRVLMNPPENIIEKEAWIRLKDKGLSTMSDAFLDEVRELFDFEGKKPIEDRIKIYTLQTEKHHIDTIKTAVRLARRYWKELEKDWKSKNEFEIKQIQRLLKKAAA